MVGGFCNGFGSHFLLSFFFFLSFVLTELWAVHKALNLASNLGCTGVRL
jgi:hypothetical protein